MKSFDDTIFLVDGGMFSPTLFGLSDKDQLFLFENGIVATEEGHSNINFVGVFYLGNKLFISVPKTSNVDEIKNDGKSKAKTLLKCLFKFSKEYSFENTEVASISNYKHQRKVSDQTKLYLSILEDYRNFGIVKFSDSVVVSQNTGKINWKKTISSSNPILNSRKVPIYTDLKVQKSISRHNDLITDIHRFVVCQIDKLFGWYFCSGSRSLLAPELTHFSELPCQKEVAIALIKNELRNEFETRKILLYKKILTYLTSDFQSKVGHFLGVSDFWRVWEHMSRKVYKDVYKNKFEKMIPQPKYLSDDGQWLGISRNIGQRFDLVAETDKALFLIDAKYYDVRKNIPGWKDLVKQYFYHKSLSMISNKPILNILMFPDPGNMKDKPKRVEMISMLKNISSEILMNEFPLISCEYFDVWAMIDYYLVDGESETFLTVHDKSSLNLELV